MKTLITLLLACCFSSAMAQSNLPACPSNVDVLWTNFYGTLTYSDGFKYIGELIMARTTGMALVEWISHDE